jgi:hypothetical protein
LNDFEDGGMSVITLLGGPGIDQTRPERRPYSPQ